MEGHYAISSWIIFDNCPLGKWSLEVSVNFKRCEIGYSDDTSEVIQSALEQFLADHLPQLKANYSSMVWCHGILKWMAIWVQSQERSASIF